MRVLLMLAIMCAPSYSSAQTALALNANAHTTEGMRVAAVTNANVQGGSAACPAAGIPAAQSAAKGTGHHKVFLSWNPSSQAPGVTGPIDGYCIYRSKDPNAAKQNAACADCERVTPVAVSSTACVDDVVENGATYYYVVTALKGNLMSASSNETRALIPDGPKSDAPRPQPGPSLLCRGKPAQATHP